jgi:hypothetical protein
LKMERPPGSIASKARREGISLKPQQPLSLQSAEDEDDQARPALAFTGRGLIE